MPRADFERKLNLVQDEVVELSSMVEKAKYKAIDALKSRDIELSKQVVEEDDDIDNKQQALDNKAFQRNQQGWKSMVDFSKGMRLGQRHPFLEKMAARPY